MEMVSKIYNVIDITSICISIFTSDKAIIMFFLCWYDVYTLAFAVYTKYFPSSSSSFYTFYTVLLSNKDVHIPCRLIVSRQVQPIHQPSVHLSTHLKLGLSDDDDDGGFLRPTLIN